MGLGFKVWGLGCKVLGPGFEVWGLGYEVLGLVVGDLGLGFEVRGLGREVSVMMYWVSKISGCVVYCRTKI